MDLHDRSRPRLERASARLHQLLSPFGMAGVAAVLLAVTVLLWIAGVLAILIDSRVLDAFDLDIEFGRTQIAVAPVWSASLLLAAAGVWWAASSGIHPTTSRLGRGLALLLAFMSADEFLSLHERIERALGVDWQVLYGPVFAVAAIGTVTLMWRVRHRGWTASLLLLGAASWGASQVLEALQWDGDFRNPGYEVMMAAEELLENLGSVCLLLAGLALAKSHAPARSIREPRAGEQPPTADKAQASALHDDAHAPG